MHQKIVAAAVLSSPKYQFEYETIVKHLLIPSKQLPDISSQTNLVLLQNDLSSDECQSSQATEQFLVTTIDDPSALTNADMQLISCQLEFETDIAQSSFTDSCKEENVSSSPVIELINSSKRCISPTATFTPSYDENLQLMDCQIELMDQFNLTDQIDFCPSDIELSDDNVVFPADEELGLVVEHSSTTSPSETNVEMKQTTKKKNEKLLEVTTKKTALKHASKIDKEKMKKGSYNVRRLMRVLESNGVVFNRLTKAEVSSMVATNSCANDKVGSNGTASLPSFEATLCSLSFTGWLESVIEQVKSLNIWM